MAASMGGGSGEGAGGTENLFSLPQVVTDPNTGAAQTSVSIKVPPGRNGLQPDLTLNYSSNRKNGWIGIGWDIPISSIKRGTKWGVDYIANDFIADDSSELVSRGD